MNRTVTLPADGANRAASPRTKVGTDNLDSKAVKLFSSGQYTIDANGNQVKPQPVLQIQEKIKQGVSASFPLLDAEPPANSPQTVFYDLQFKEIPKGTFSVVDSPKTTAFNKALGNQKLDHLEYSSEFTISVVHAFSDGSVYSIGSTKWSFDVTLTTQFTDANNNRVEDQGERSPVLGRHFGNGQFEIGPVIWNQTDNDISDNPPSKLIPPVANDALEIVPVP